VTGSRAEGVAENRCRSLGRGRPRTAISPKKEGRKQWEKNEIITAGQPERERRRKEK